MGAVGELFTRVPSCTVPKQLRFSIIPKRERERTATNIYKKQRLGQISTTDIFRDREGKGNKCIVA
jgi:hypothetical protein